MLATNLENSFVHVNVSFVDSDDEIGGGVVVEGFAQRVGHALGTVDVDYHGTPRDPRGREEGENVMQRSEARRHRGDDALSATLTPQIHATRLRHGRGDMGIVSRRNLHKTT